MLSDRRWRLAAAAVVVAVAGVLTFVVSAGDGDDDAASVATRATTTTSTSTSSSTTTTTIVASTDPPTSVVSTASTAARVPVTTVTTVAPRCPQPRPGSDFDGFGSTEIVIQNPEGSRRSCVLTADTPSQQSRGLMRQNDLDGYEGMIFRFPTAEEQSFWMRNTSIPLSIAFFDAGGAFVSATDMEPCGDSPSCPSYRSNGAARFALEVLRGRLPAVGATAGSRLVG